ncbi:class I SAM-dependent methyltransferase [Methylomarinum vadi]|uniref:class I SAM-dependent methyltransferase n=1 Tax=Methylomarinum vadi TaxID=438855 RepID=UPI0004DF8601|nr:class I SAM-dependent methyltransferase [Methylomarinum vadi]
MNKKIVSFCAALLCLSAGPLRAANSLHSIISGEQRSAENQARDRYRHPEETLAFFDVQEDMTVVEIWPGAGWYTEILAPYLRDKGLLYAAHFSPASTVPYFQKSVKAFKGKIAADPDAYGKLRLTVLQPPKQVEIAPAGSADRVLTFRNVHNWMRTGQAETVFKAMFKALKPGGILGVVEHRNPTYIKQDPQAQSGYVREDYVIGLAEKAGFKLLDKSEINANPKDTGKHPKGVWSLPPSLREGKNNRDEYLAIGESDRMTLKFGKPEE